MTSAGNRAWVPAAWADRGDARDRSGAARGRSRQGRRLALTAAGLSGLTAVMLVVEDRADLDNVLLLYLLAVVIVAITAGRTAALAAAVVSFVLEIYLFASPRRGLVLGHDQLVELMVFLVAAVLVSVVADAGARHRVAARVHEDETKLLSELAAIRSGGSALVAVLAHVRNRLGFSWLRVVETDADEGSQPVAQVGDPDTAPLNVSVTAGHGLRVEGGADPPPPSHRNALVLQAVADTLAQSWREEQLADEVAQARQLAEIDRVRNSLLDAVSHDLRTPLAGIKANASALRHADTGASEELRAELVAAIEESADQLTALVTNLLAMSRIRAGTVSASLTAVPLYEVVSRALVTIGDQHTDVEVSEHLPLVRADEALLERVVANLVTNAHQHAGGGGLPIIVRAEPVDGGVRLSVVDHGPGIAEDRWSEVFQPFQRLDDSGAGLGLGLAIARGFSEAMGVSLLPSQTPGGGLTMTVVLERSR